METDESKELEPETVVRVIFQEDVEVQRFDIIAGQSYYDVISKGCEITETLFLMDDGEKRLLFMNGTTGNFFWLTKEGITIKKI